MFNIDEESPGENGYRTLKHQTTVITFVSVVGGSTKDK